MKKRKKILFGAVDIGYRHETYSKFIQQNLAHVLEADTLAIYVLPKKHYVTNYTYEYNYHTKGSLYRWFLSGFNFVRFLFMYDIFHFLSGETLLTRKLRTFELFVYKLLGKRVVMHFVGADIRSPEYLQWKNDHIDLYLGGADRENKTLPWQQKMIADTLKYASAVLVSTPDLLEIIPSAIYYPVVIDKGKFLEELKSNPPSRVPSENEIVILHCPSNIMLKGTQFIHESLQRVASLNSYSLRFILPTKKNNPDGTPYALDRYELFQYMQEADIIIDQMIIGWYGIQSIEGILSNKEVICYIDEKLKKYLYPQCPIHVADVHTLDKVLVDCIEKVLAARKKNVGSNAQAWVDKYHTIENNHDALLNAWGINASFK